MVQTEINYQGELHCSLVHGPSGMEIATDAPVDNHGRGEAFSPTDLTAASLGACMCTMMGIAAQRKEVALEGLKVVVRKHMSSDAPRRIVKLEVDLAVPLAPDHPERALLEATAKSCPVHHSLHPDIDVAMNWDWIG